MKAQELPIPPGRVEHAIGEKGERARVEAWALVAVMVGVGALGTGVGYFLDWRLRSGPWLLLVGAVVGLGAGLFFMLRSALAYARREKPRSQRGSDEARPTVVAAQDVHASIKAPKP